MVDPLVEVAHGRPRLIPPGHIGIVDMALPVGRGILKLTVDTKHIGNISHTAIIAHYRNKSESSPKINGWEFLTTTNLHEQTRTARGNLYGACCSRLFCGQVYIPLGMKTSFTAPQKIARQ
jgi:hypothetical protein